MSITLVFTNQKELAPESTSPEEQLTEKQEATFDHRTAAAPTFSAFYTDILETNA